HIMNETRELRPQYGMIQRRKMLYDIDAQHVAISPCPLLQLIDCAVRALADPVSIAMRDETGLEHRLDDIAQRVMHDAVSKGRGADLAPLRLMDEEVTVRAGPIRLHAQIVLHR